MKKRLTRGVLPSMLVLGGLLTGCVPDPGSVVLHTETFTANHVTVDDSQDETCVIICVNQSDEAYVLNVNFQLTIGSGIPATTWVTGHRDNQTGGIGAGSGQALTGGQQATATFSNIQTMDVLDLLDANKHLTVFGSYTWVMEADTIGVQTAANDVATVLASALHVLTDVTAGNTQLDANTVVQLILDHLDDAFTLLLSNVPTLGLGDDALGGAFYLGIGATGALASIIDGTIGTATMPSLDIPVLDLPPDVQHIGIYTMGSSKTFAGQSFSGADGQHTYEFSAQQTA